MQARCLVSTANNAVMDNSVFLSIIQIIMLFLFLESVTVKPLRNLSEQLTIVAYYIKIIIVKKREHFSEHT